MRVPTQPKSLGMLPESIRGNFGAKSLYMGLTPQQCLQASTHLGLLAEGLGQAGLVQVLANQ